MARPYQKGYLSRTKGPDGVKWIFAMHICRFFYKCSLLFSSRIGNCCKGLRILQAIEITFTGRQIDPGVCHATQQSPLPWGHAKESFHYGARRIGLSVQTDEPINEFLGRHALGLVKDRIWRMALEPPVMLEQPAFA